MQTSVISILTLVLGVAGMCLSCMVIGVIPSIIAIVLGAIALKDDLSYKWPSILGIMCSAIGVIMFVIVLIETYDKQYGSYLATPNEIVRKYTNDTYEPVTIPNEELEAIEPIAAETETVEPPIQEVDLPDGEYFDVGEGIFYLVNSSGTSEGGNIPVIFLDEDTILTQIGLNAESFNGANLSYIYVDGYLLSKEQLGDSQNSLTLEGDNLAHGTHKVEVVQYENDDTASNMITYKTANYEVKGK